MTTAYPPTSETLGIINPLYGIRMKEKLTYIIISIVILSCNPNVKSQQKEDLKPESVSENYEMESSKEVETVISNAQIELENSNFFDETIDSWWHTEEFWEGGVKDGVRSIILYTIIDSSKVMKNVELLRVHQFETFTNHKDVSSLINKLTILFPDETLMLLTEIMTKYQAGMKIFDPYGDHICKNLYNKLDQKKKANLDLLIVQLLNEESVNFNNWFPIFRLLTEHGQNKEIKIILESNHDKLKGINKQIYFNAIVQAKAKVNGFSFYDQLIKEIYTYYNQKNEGDQYRYYSIYNGLKAIKLIVENSALSKMEKEAILVDLSEFKRILNSNKHSIENIELLESEIRNSI